MNRFAIILAVGALFSSPAFADMHHDFRSRILAEIKAAESYSHQERIRILQEADACIKAATTREQYRACEERERQARENLREQMKAQREARR